MQWNSPLLPPPQRKTKNKTKQIKTPPKTQYSEK
jgi:hypothetical protein